MNKKILHFIKEQQLFSTSQTIILALSGGKDSMALWHFLLENGFCVVAVHCNFTLRGKESDLDATFVERMAKRKNTRLHVFTFETENYAKTHKISIQEAARKLRYDILEKVRLKENAVAIVTAHHLDDNIETLLQKLIKGTGVKGLRAMLPKQGHIVRPLLETSVDEIIEYIKLHEILYREDASNASIKYDRNKIRHEITPVLKELNAGYYKTFGEHFKRWQAIESVYDGAINMWRDKLFKPKKSDIFISKRALLKIKGVEALLFELLKPYSFTAADIKDLLTTLQNPKSKVFYSASYRLLVDKKFLVITPLQLLQDSSIHNVLEKDDKIKFENGVLRFHYKPINKHVKFEKSKNTAYIDTSKLLYPLELRKWKAGDYFYPLGFVKKSGKPNKKKLAKYFKDEKISIREKEQTWVLVSNDKIVWIVGQRLDHRFGITDKTKEMCVLKFIAHNS